MKRIYKVYFNTEPKKSLSFSAKCFVFICVPYVLVFMLFLLLPLVAVSSKIDSLRHILFSADVMKQSTAIHDTSRVKILNNLANLYLSFAPDTALMFSTQALKLSEKIKFQKGIAASYDNITRYHWMLGNYSKALENLFEKLKVYEHLKDNKTISATLGNIGLIYYNQGDYPKSLSYYFKAIKADSLKENKKGIAGLLSNIGLLYWAQRDYTKALSYHFESLEMDSMIGNKKGTASSLGNIGIVYADQGDYAKALSYHFKSLEMDSMIGNNKGIATTLNNIGIIYFEQTELQHGSDSTALRAQLYDKALFCYFKSLKIDSVMGNKKGMAICLGNIGTLYSSTKKFTEAEKYLKQALEVSIEIETLNIEMDQQNALSKLYEKTKRYQFALLHYKKAVVAKDTLFNEEKSKEIGKLEQTHEFEMAEIEKLRIKNEELRIQNEKIKRRNMLQYSGIVLGLIALFFGIFLLARRFRIIQEKKTYKRNLKIIEGALFVSFLIFFEFILVFLDPYLENLTGGEPAYKFFVNAILAGIIFPLHSFLETKLKASVIHSEMITSKKMSSLPKKNMLLLVGFVFISLSNISFSDKADSLETELKNVKNDTIKINLLNKLFLEYEFKNREIAKKYIKQAFDLSGKVAYSKGLAQCYMHLGYFEDDVGNYLQAIHYYKKSLHISKLSGDKKSISATLGNIGLTYWNQGDFQKAFNYYFRALKMDEIIGNKSGIAKHLGNIGIIYDEQGDFPNALKFYFQALKIDEKISNKNGLVKHLGNIGIIYREQRDFSKALEYFLKALQLGEELNNKNYIAIQLGNIGNIYDDQKDYLKALDYYFKALKIDEALGNKNRIARHVGNIGMMYYNHANRVGQDSAAFKNQLLVKAMDFYLRALKISEEIENKDLVAVWISSIGSLYTSINKYAEAEKYLLKALEIDKEIKAVNNEMYDEQIISRLYEKTGRFDLALEHFKKSISVKDLLFSEEKSKEIGRLEQKHEFEMEELNNERIKNEELRIKKEKTERRNLLQYSSILLVLLFVFGLVFFLGRVPLPEWLLGLITIVPFMILFEFILVLMEPYIENYTGGAPLYKLLINAMCAVIIFPIHGFFEKKLKTRIHKVKKEKEEKYAEEFRKEVEKFDEQ